MPSARDMTNDVEDNVTGVVSSSVARLRAPMDNRLGVPIDKIMYTKHMKHQTLRNV